METRMNRCRYMTKSVGCCRWSKPWSSWRTATPSLSSRRFHRLSSREVRTRSKASSCLLAQSIARFSYSTHVARRSYSDLTWMPSGSSSSTSRSRILPIWWASWLPTVTSICSQIHLCSFKTGMESASSTCRHLRFSRSRFTKTKPKTSSQSFPRHLLKPNLWQLRRTSLLKVPRRQFGKTSLRDRWTQTCGTASVIASYVSRAVFLTPRVSWLTE